MGDKGLFKPSCPIEYPLESTEYLFWSEKMGSKSPAQNAILLANDETGNKGVQNADELRLAQMGKWTVIAL